MAEWDLGNSLAPPSFFFFHGSLRKKGNLFLGERCLVAVGTHQARLVAVRGSLCVVVFFSGRLEHVM